MADWSMIPCDILAEIARKLDRRLDDLIRFSAVCHSWNDAFSLVKSVQNPNVPWLLLAENTTENPDYLRKAYHLSHDKCYQLKVPETFGKRCWGSSYGWIAMQTFNHQVHLFSPLTKVQITSLPSILTLNYHQRKANDPPGDPDDSDEDYDPLESQKFDFDHFVLKLIVLKMPRNRPLDGDDDGDGDGDLLVAIIYGEFDCLAFARPGDQSWTFAGETYVMDVACWGDDIYIVRCSGQLLCCDIKGCGGNLKDLRVMEYAPGNRPCHRGSHKSYLLKLCGDLVMVVRDLVDETFGLTYRYYTRSFELYKLDKIKKWVKIDNIGNYAIFVGHHSSMSIPAISVSNNCIYFTDDEEHYTWRNLPGYGGSDMGVYDIGSRDIKQFYQGDDTRSLFCPPIFFLPKYSSTD